MHDQAVIRDNNNALFLCFVHNSVQSLTINSRDQQKADAIRQQLLNIIHLLIGFIVGIGHFDFVAGFFKCLLQEITVAVPAFKCFGGHCNTDLLGSAFGSSEGAQAQNQGQSENQGYQLLHNCASPFFFSPDSLSGNLLIVFYTGLHKL